MSLLRTAFVLSCIALIALAPVLRAQMAESTAITTALRGVLLDPQGRPIAGDELRLVTRDTKVVATARTGQHGGFRFEELSRAQLIDGTYTIVHDGKRADIPVLARSSDAALIVVASPYSVLRISALVVTEAALAAAKRLRDNADPKPIDTQKIDAYAQKHAGEEVPQQLVEWARAKDQKAMGAILAEDDDKVGGWLLASRTPIYIGAGVLAAAGIGVGTYLIVDNNTDDDGSDDESVPGRPATVVDIIATPVQPSTGGP